MTDCEICWAAETPVRLRRWITPDNFYDEGYLCADCWLDVCAATERVRQEP